MQIRCENDATRALKVAKFGGLRVEFSKNGFATVPDEVGRYLVRKNAFIKDTTKKPAVKKPRETQVKE